MFDLSAVYRIVARHGSTFARKCGVDLGIATTRIGISIKSRLVVNGYNAELISWCYIVNYIGICRYLILLQEQM